MKYILIACLAFVLVGCGDVFAEEGLVYSNGDKKLYITAFRYSPFDNEKEPRICFTYEDEEGKETVIIPLHMLKQLSEEMRRY